MIHGRTRAVGRDGGGSGWFPGTGWYFGDSCVHRESMKTRGSNTPTRWYSLTRDWRTSSRPVFLVRPILSCEHFLVFAAIFRNNSVHVKRSAQVPMDESQRDDQFYCPILFAIRCTGDGKMEQSSLVSFFCGNAVVESRTSDGKGTMQGWTMDAL